MFKHLGKKKHFQRPGPILGVKSTNCGGVPPPQKKKKGRDRDRERERERKGERLEREGERERERETPNRMLM